MSGLPYIGFFLNWKHWKKNDFELDITFPWFRTNFRKVCKDWIFHQDNILQYPYSFPKSVLGYLTFDYLVQAVLHDPVQPDGGQDHQHGELSHPDLHQALPGIQLNRLGFRNLFGWPISHLGRIQTGCCLTSSGKFILKTSVGDSEPDQQDSACFGPLTPNFSKNLKF